MSSEESETDFEDVENEKIDSTQLFLVNSIKQFPVVLQKSQIPSAKEKKHTSLNTICNLYQNNFGKPITVITKNQQYEK